jgi:hypothetical protein
MARFGVYALAAAFALALAGCGDGSYSGLSAGVETVEDAAAIVAHRPTGTQYAATAIGAVDTLGAVLGGLSNARDLERANAERLTFCQAFAGSGGGRVPALGMSFGWQGTTNGAFEESIGGIGDAHAVLALASGTAIVGPEGSMEPLSGAPRASCAKARPAFAALGPSAPMSFRIPLHVAYRSGRLWSVTVSHAAYGNYWFELSPSRSERDPRMIGIVGSGRARIAYLRADRFGNGDLTITPTGAQYRLVDWMVAG